MPEPLRVVVAPGCAGCLHALELVRRVRRERPDYPVEVVDLAGDAGPLPDEVIGTPTYLLGERVVWLGNPPLPDLLARLDRETAGADGAAPAS